MKLSFRLLIAVLLVGLAPAMVWAEGEEVTGVRFLPE